MPARRLKPRSAGAQIDRMRHAWPQLELEQSRDDTLRWTGPVRGFQKEYVIQIFWNPRLTDRPYVFLLKPQLRPREGTTFEEIPHLMFNTHDPEKSALCLFDPNGKQWSPAMLIADTTVPWVGRWLLYYELWLADGIWRGGGIGLESFAASQAAALHG